MIHDVGRRVSHSSMIARHGGPTPAADGGGHRPRGAARAGAAPGAAAYGLYSNISKQNEPPGLRGSGVQAALPSSIPAGMKKPAW